MFNYFVRMMCLCCSGQLYSINNFRNNYIRKRISYILGGYLFLLQKQSKKAFSIYLGEVKIHVSRRKAI